MVMALKTKWRKEKQWATVFHDKGLNGGYDLLLDMLNTLMVLAFPERDLWVGKGRFVTVRG